MTADREGGEPNDITWITDMPGAAWDAALGRLGGHPLQSALWGDARAAIDAISNLRWAAFGSGGQCLFLARVETRRIPGVGKFAWIPRGPVTAKNVPFVRIQRDFLKRLRADGFLGCIEDPYPCRNMDAVPGMQLLPKPHTIWIDLTVGRDQLMAKLHAQWRAGVRTAARAGVVIERALGAAEVAGFYGMCKRISEAKGFVLPGSESLMRALHETGHGPDTEAALFLARYKGQVAAGVFALRCGRSVHYIWGASDRNFAKQRPGEAVHWAVIEWALACGARIYDLEGVDPEGDPNAGVYAFKRRMGGAEVELPGKIAYPLGIRGRFVLQAARWLRRI